MKGDSIHTFENGGKENGFFCMKLVSFLSQEREANQLDPEQFSELWATVSMKRKQDLVVIGISAQYIKEHCKSTREFN